MNSVSLSPKCIIFAPKTTKMEEGTKQKNSERHPIFLLGDKVEREGVVVVNNITSQPLDGETYVSPYAMVALCVQGTALSEYDTMPVEFHTQDMTLLRKGHVLRGKETSADYHARFIIMSDEFYEKFKHLNIQRFNTHNPYYVQHPSCHLTDEQFRQINLAFDMLEVVSSAGSHYSEEMQLNALSIIFMLHFEYNPIPENPHLEDTNRQLAQQFKEAIIEHYRQSREVSFYARLFNLSPKYFSTLIKQETGSSAGELIDRYLVLQAKSILQRRRDLSIQQVAYQLGFTEQASFSRFFKNKTGQSPKEFRDIH